MSRSSRNRHYKNRQGRAAIKTAVNTKSAVHSGRREPAVTILKEYNQMLRLSRDYFSWQASYCYGFLAAKASACLYQDTAVLSKLSKYDSMVFPAYERILTCYSEYKNTYLKTMENINSAPVREILSGLNEIISMRLKEAKSLKEKDMVAYEKDSIINQYVSLFSHDASALAVQEFGGIVNKAELLGAGLENALDAGELDRIYHSINCIIKETFLEPLFKAYNFNVDSGLKALNLEANRPMLVKYTNLLKEEFDILQSIVKIQVAELEKFKDDEEAVYIIMNLIREVYQIVKHDIELIEEGRRYAEGIYPEKLKSFEDFAAALESEIQPVDRVFETQDFIRDYNVKLECFRSTLFEYGREVFNKHLLLQFNDNQKNNLFRLSDKTVRMTEEICMEFKGAVLENENFFETISGLTQEIQIIKGINDTLVIKAESLEENLLEFRQTAKELKEFNYNISHILNDEFMKKYSNELFNEFRQAFGEICEIDRESILKLRKRVKGCAAKYVSDALLQYSRKLDTKLEPLKKKDFAFKKDVLLFEISTFEEIMKYSVSKLKESENQQIMDYVDSIEKMNGNIGLILESFHIYPIEPKEHDLFNAKEHEVLMAEKTEGFSKGEIVKVLARGYRQDETVIIRANIQAAR